MSEEEFELEQEVKSTEVNCNSPPFRGLGSRKFSQREPHNQSACEFTNVMTSWDSLLGKVAVNQAFSPHSSRREGVNHGLRFDDQPILMISPFYLVLMMSFPGQILCRTEA
jgi:hypothetical protein